MKPGMTTWAMTASAFAAGIVVALAGAAVAGGGYGGGPGGGSLYDRIHARYAPYGRDVRETFRDGPCTIKRHWERDGDFDEEIECRP